MFQLGQGHRTVILSCMERVVKESSESLDKTDVIAIIKQASNELTASKVSHAMSVLIG